ncbi:TPA: hypothetical protein DDW35_04875, partial [Candidatus Sumerlaeota bacterium]|nr:hypothetical protein [Candidatus Sumerlaeota bacterium]
MKLTGFRGIVLAALTLVAPALCVTQGTSAMAESSAATQAASASRSTVGTASQTADPKYDAQIAQAVRYYEDANFEKALACYEGALKLTPDNAVLKSKIDSTHKNIEYKQQLLEKTPGFDKNRDAILEKRYDKALALYQAGKKDEARAAFTEVWVLGGKYKLAHEYLKAIVNGTTVPAPSTVAANSDAAPTTTDTPAKDDQVAQALDSAKAAAKAGDYVKAVESCSAALKIDSENAKARKALLKYQELQQKAQQESEKLAAANALKAEQEKAQAQAKQNEARVAELLSAGKQNCKDGNFDGGISNADAALQLDPANKKALALKNAAQKSKDESVVQAQKDKELASAQAQKDKEL